MQLPNLTSDQVRSRCTDQSFRRGLAYFHAGAIGNPVCHGWTLSATCQGTARAPYQVSVALMPTGIAAAECSCPYDWGGDCKHIVALLLTYAHEPEGICDMDALLTRLAEKPKRSLLQIISELLKRTPRLVPVVLTYADMPDQVDVDFCDHASRFGSQSAYADMLDQVDVDSRTTAHKATLPATVEVYSERVDRIFGRDFLEQHQLRNVLVQLEKLRHHAESLLQLGESEFALIILHALIRQSVVRSPDTLQRGELPRFVNKCTKTFARVAMNVQQPPETLEHCRMLLQLSFDGEPIFTLPLTRLLEQLCPTQEIGSLQTTLEQHLDGSPDRQAHVRLLLALYDQANRAEEYLRFSQAEGENYRFIHALFTQQRDDAAWKAVAELPLAVDEYWHLLQSPIAKRMSGFTEKLFSVLRHHVSGTTIVLYQKCIEQIVLSRKQEGYERAQRYLIDLKQLYQHLNKEDQWVAYLTHFRKQHSRKRLLLRIIADI